MTSIFVYGTLKRGGVNHPFIAGQTFLGAARTSPGFTLFSLGGYPGMVPSPTDRDGVTGEVWSVTDACLAELDELEGIAEALYGRASVPLLAPFESASVQTYFYLRRLAGAPHLGSSWEISVNQNQLGR